jgi:hypothetical protein
MITSQYDHKIVFQETTNVNQSMTNNAAISTATLGFARMGPRRELKFALEKHWKGALTLEGLLDVSHKVEEMAWNLHAGIDQVAVGNQYLYDGILTWTEWLGIVPSRFGGMKPGVDRMFAMARGVDGAPALSKTLPCVIIFALWYLVLMSILTHSLVVVVYFLQA